MTRWIKRALLFAAFLCTGAASAAVEISYDGCVDAAGDPVEAVKDTALARVVETGRDAGRAAIRYNPEALPRLQYQSRLFLFAHACARANLGLPAAESSLADARRADCEGLATLLRSRLVDASQIDALEADLAFSPGEWPLVPGPARQIRLRACLDELAARPSLVSPPPSQPDWNACVRGCGEPLRMCRKSCAGAGCEACQQRYERCSSLCDFRFSP